MSNSIGDGIYTVPESIDTIMVKLDTLELRGIAQMSTLIEVIQMLGAIKDAVTEHDEKQRSKIQDLRQQIADMSGGLIQNVDVTDIITRAQSETPVEC